MWCQDGIFGGLKEVEHSRDEKARTYTRLVKLMRRHYVGVSMVHNLTFSSLFVELNAIGIVLEGEDQTKLKSHHCDGCLAVIRKSLSMRHG